MTPLFTARRRAEDFHTLVEGESSVQVPRFEEQLALVAQLRDVPVPEPDAEFTADLRERLLAAADTLLVPSEETRRLTLPPRRTARDRLVAAAVGAVAVAGATTSLAVAAQSALPGDMLYPVKRVMEQAQTRLHPTDEGRGELMLEHATDRLSEATTLSLGGDLAEGEHVAQALVDFADQSTAASDLLLSDYDENGDEAAIRELRGFTATSLQSLTELEAVLPEEARDELLYAVQVLDEIDHAAAKACPSCGGGISQIPAVLLSAGRVTEPSLTAEPDPLLPGTSFEPGAGDEDKPPKRKHDGKDGSTDGSSDGGGLPGVEVPASTGGGSGGDSSGDEGPLDTLTGGLTGQLDDQTSGGGGGGLTGVPEVDETLDDVVEDLDDALPDLP